MKTESAAFLRKAREFLTKARNQLDMMRYSDEAGRAAYLAGLHAAQALIFERSGDRVAVSTASLPEAVRVFVRV